MTLNPSPSENGRFVAFRSATNLLAPQAYNAVPQLFLHDTELRTNYWLSLTTTNNSGISPTNGPAVYVSDGLISKDSRVVAFAASNLSEPLGPFGHWLYLYSIDTGARFTIPVPDSVPAASQRIASFDLSADAQKVVYTFSHLPLPDGTRHQLFLYDRSSNTNRLLATFGNEAPAPQISDDGNRFIFTRTEANGRNAQLFLYDQASGNTQLLSRSASGAEADEPVLNAALSGDGSIAGFETLASNLATNDDPAGFDLFTVGLSGTNFPRLVSTAHSAAIASTAAGQSELAQPYYSYYRQAMQVSTDGQRVLLASSAPDLAPEDLLTDIDLFLADRGGTPTRLISSPTNAPLGSPILMDASADLNRVLFAEGRSLYLFDRNAQASIPATIFPDGSIGLWRLYSADLSIDGTHLLFVADDWRLCVRDLEKQETRFVADAQYGFLYPYLDQISDGGRYVLNPASTSANQRGTHVIDHQTGQKRTLIDLFAVASAWDDSIMLFARPLPSRSVVELWTYDPVSHQTNLVATNATLPTLSGDGSVIAYSQNVDNRWRSFVYETATATTTPLMIDGQDLLFEQNPVITPDGRIIAFTIDSAEAGATRENNLYVFDRVTTNLSTIAAPNGGPIAHLRRYAISADGRTVVFDSADDQLVANDRNLNTDTFAVRLTVMDTDGDSLEDGWEIQHFGTLDQSASADADTDGVSNAQEFQTGTDPRDAASRFTLSATLTSSNAVILEWPAVLGKTYQIQTSTTLSAGSWTNSGPPITAFNRNARVTIPANSSAFYRVSILQ